MQPPSHVLDDRVHGGVLLTQYVLNPDGLTPYEDVHGHKVNQQLVEFGERMLFFVPKTRRAKLDLRWASGIFLGNGLSSPESYIGLPNGNVVKARVLSWLTEDRRWRVDLVQRILGTPLHPNPLDPEHDWEASFEPPCQR